MKKIVLVFTIFALFSVSCSNEVTSNMVGKWKFVDIQEQLAPNMQGMSAPQIQLMKDSCWYAFYSNKTYEMFLVSTKDKGDWYLSENGKVLNTKSSIKSRVQKPDGTFEEVAPEGKAVVRRSDKDTLELVVQQGIDYTLVMKLAKFAE